MRLKFWLCSHPKRTRPWSNGSGKHLTEIRRTVNPANGKIRKVQDARVYETCLQCGQELEVKMFTEPLDIEGEAEEKTFFRSVEELL